MRGMCARVRQECGVSCKDEAEVDEYAGMRGVCTGVRQECVEVSSGMNMHG